MTIVKSHGGFVDVYSEVGKGTQVSIYLPSSEEPKEDATTEKLKLLPRGDGELVLIVDDEENIRKIAEATLARFGYRTVTAADGADALNVYAEHAEDISIVLTDIAMPHMDGETLIRTLKKLAPATPVVAMSGLMSPEQTAALEMLNVGGFLSKPFTAEELLTILADVIKSR